MKLPLSILDIDGFGHMMDWDYMMGWWGIPFMGFWSLLIWIVQIIVAVVVYKDAEKKKKNGLLWFVLVILPWIGILFLIIYLTLRGEETDTYESIYEGQRILDERYAKGEIAREEYLQAQKDLEEMKRKT